eukprot:CAMPEP_0174818130 /NCGR_PEP_ID=MMETSP1107-20130205/756_1 /TAXON_ID=36770 /ORGANISM="Paraphysomonas vestita, Strain GFlagA" /LENGTH=568 /DNA_ID=CAMNT_0016029579 /DNA_START=107 /DNA_END=1813 /DNA_ORIENTATION=-
MLPMRDNIKLHTIIFFPRDYEEGKKYTAVVDRSPYGYGDMEWLTDIFLPFGFVAVGQDMRGTELSEGNFTMWQSDKWDSEDLGNWIVSQEWSNGKIFTLGASADGIASLQTPVNNPPWLEAQYIVWAPANMYDILFPYGTYKQETTEDWLFGLEMPNPDVVYDNIQTVYDNEAETPYWQGIITDDEVYANVHCPSAFWAGWYDLFIVGTLEAFEGYNTKSNPAVRYTSKMTIDPLGHCLDGSEFFTEDVVMGRTLLMIAQLFEVYGIRPVARRNIKNITFYVMSSNDEAGKQAGQYWTSLETWPTPKMTNYYFHSDGTLSTSRPSTSEKVDHTSYKVDPANPVVTVGGNNLPPDIGGSINCGPMDQSEVDKRDDVLLFQTPPLSSDLPLTGGLYATLYVSSDVIDTDFMVKISDLYPTGEAILIQDNAIRMRWREGGLKPVYMKEGVVYEVTINLWNTSWIIPAGHSLRVSVQSSNNPRFSVNPHNGLLLNDPLYPGENIVATNTLYHSFKYPSHITLPVVNKRQIPEIHLLKEVQEVYPEITTEMAKKFSDGLMNHIKGKFSSKNKK